MDEAANGNPRGAILRKALQNIMESDFESAARRFQLWRMCRRSPCRRARACCGDARACCGRFIDWSEALVAADRDVDMSRARRALMRQLGESAA